MLRFRKFLPALAILAAAAVLGMPSPARATFTVRVYEDNALVSGGSITNIDPQNILYAFTTANSTLQFFNVTSGSGTSNWPGTGGGSNMDLANNTKITTNFGAAGGTHSIRIELTQDLWTAPTGSPLNLSSSVGGSFATLTTGPTASVASTYKGFLDNTDTLFGQPAGGSTPTQSASASRTSAGTSSLVYSPPISTATVPGGTPFSMTDVLSFTFTQAAGAGQSSVNASASTTATSVPAPAGLVLALSGFPILGIGAWRLRRRQPV